MVRNRFTKPVLIVLGVATLGVFSFATLIVIAAFAVQSTRTAVSPVTPAAIQQFDQSSQSSSVSSEPDLSRAAYASIQSENGDTRQYRPASGSVPAAHYAPASYGWMQQASPDGSATLALPANWRVSGGAKGSVAIEGPDSEQVVLGFQTFVMSSQAPYMAPEQAMAWFARTRGIQVLDIQNRGAEGGASSQAEMMVIDSELQGRKYKSVARVTTSPIGMGNWMLQISSMAAPVESFDADFPTMQRIWNSWGLNKGYVQNGFDTAAQIHQQTTQTAVNHAINKVNSWNAFNEQFDQNIRGVSTMENSTLGKRSEIQIGTEPQYLHDCTRQGQDCRQVPTNELAPPQ